MMDKRRNALDVCSAKEFLAHMPEFESAACQEVIRKKKADQLSVFWYPTGSNEPHRNFTKSGLSAASAVNAKALSVQAKIKESLLSLRCLDDEHMFVQYWTTRKTSSGRNTLSVLEQPFGVGTLCHDFCSYRYICMKLDIQVYSSRPVGRVFSRGSPEYCGNIEHSYPIEEFPLINYVKFCKSYLALPVYDHGLCIGVFEFHSTRAKSLCYENIVCQLEGSDFKFTTSHSHLQICRQLQTKDNLPEVLTRCLGTKQIPLIQIWVPCFLDQTNRVTKLFCHWTSSSHPYPAYGSLFMNYANGIYYVENGKGVVGRAFSQRKLCYFEDTSKLSISDYPLVHLTRTSGLTACLVIPAQLVHPNLSHMVLEVFLPPEKSCDHDYIVSLLKSLFPSYLAKDGEFCVQYSHSDAENYVYFDVSEKRQYVSPHKPLVNEREGCHFQPSLKEGNDQDHGIHAAALDKFEISSKSFMNGGYENRDGDQVHGHEICESNWNEKQQLSSRVQPPATANSGDSNVQEIVKTSRKFADAAEKFEGRLPSQKRKEMHEIEPEIGTCPNKRARENVAADANIIPAASAKSKDITAGVEEIDRGYRIIVKATYKDDLAKFFLWSNSRIEELHKELHKRFKLEAEKFKVKYKDDEGNWILLSCEEDLHFHLETSKTPGQTGFELLVIPLTD